jgi:hydrogenase nickel incorporation protein HypA/HybF
MHEYSLAVEVIKLAKQIAESNNAAYVTDIDIEVGNMRGVEPDTLASAIDLLKEGPLLGKASVNIKNIKGIGKCDACNREFEMNNRVDTCPYCGSFPSEIRGGNEFRVTSIVIEK